MNQFTNQFDSVTGDSSRTRPPAASSLMNSLIRILITVPEFSKRILITT
jgi:hypothetical protein